MGIEKDTIARVLTEFTQLREAAAACHAWGGQNLQMIDAGLQQAASRLKTILARQTADADRDLQQTLATAAQMFDASVNREVRQEIDRATRHLGPLASPWSDPAWQRYQPGDITSGQPNFPGALRVGTLAWGSGSHAGMAPAMLPLIGARSALIHGSAATHDRAVEALQSVSTRLVSVFPPGHYRLTLIDSGGVGQNLKHFLRLPSQVRRDKIYSESREIEAELKRLLHHVETVTQSRLLDVATIEEYNARIGEVSVPYQFLIVVDFPAGFTELSAATLLSLAQNGPRTGTYVLATVDLRLPMPRSFDYAAFQAACTMLTPSPDGYRWNDPLFARHTVSLDVAPPSDLAQRLLDGAAAVAGQSTNRGIPFGKIAVPESERWKASSAGGLFIDIGVDSNGEPHEFELGSDVVHHGLIGGATRMGKSNLLHVLLMQLVSRYSPAELQLYLIDFKEGVEFQDYVTHRLPHARVITIANDPEYGLSVLAELQREISRRGELFRQVGSSTIKEYRQSTGKPLPRVLFVMDEFQILFGDDSPRSVSPVASAALNDLVRRGAGFGVHVLLSSQSPSSSFTSDRSSMNQLALRISLRCPEADARLILGESNDAAKMLERPGEAIYNAGNGLPERNVFLQVARLEPDDRKRRLKEIAVEATKPVWRSRIAREPMLVFDATTPARITANREFALAAQRAVELRGADPLRLWLGEAIDIKPHTAAIVERRSRSNLLIAGQDEETAHAMLGAVMLSLSAQRPGNRLEMTVLGLGRAAQPWSTSLLETASSLPGYKVVLTGVAQAEQAIERIATIVADRRASPGDHPDLFLLIAGLDRFDALRESDRYGDPGPCGDAFAQILNDGPAVGVHVAAWTGSYSAIERFMKRADVHAFGLRVAMALPASEANTFLGDAAASRLPRNRSLFRDDTWGGDSEKFKPYMLPSLEELTAIRDALKKRTRSGPAPVTTSVNE